MTRPEQRPEGALIQRALDRLDISVKTAAQRANLSDTRLRHIISGYEPLGAGQYRAITSRAGQLARIAKALEITPDELEQAGRGDAAEVLRDRLSAPERVAEVPDLDLKDAIHWVYEQPWSAEEKQQVIAGLIELDRQAQRDRERRAG